jgi:methyltransferase (TIGR00027 family)
MADVVLTPLEDTARWTAAVRSLETAREDALFRDPLAASLAGAEGAAWLATRTPDSVLPIVLRTRYFDDWLARVVAAGLSQVVLPGAGLDTRAYRLDVPEGVMWYEVDRRRVLEDKQRVLVTAGARPRCRRVTVAADLAGDWGDALVAAGFQPGQPAAWLLEGLLFYLPPRMVEAVLDQVTALAAPASALGFDIVNAAVLTSPWTRPWVEMQAAAGAPWLGTMEDPVATLAALGWAASLSQAGQPDASHGRWSLPVLPVAAADLPHNWFVTAVRGR